MDEQLLFHAPEVDLEDAQVIDDVRSMRVALADVLRVPRRWSGGLRRTTQARAIRGSNTIEGYTVSAEDAVAAVDEQPPLSADERTWAEIIGYRRVLTYVLRMAPESGFGVDSQLLRSLHFMLVEHDLVKDPGRFRTGAVDVQDESTGEVVYEGPDAVLVPDLVDQLAETLNDDLGEPMVDAAMAHLNLVMIHPFRDGNGRMARALQTLVMARDQVLEPTFSSIEEWLGRNTEDYYRVLALTGGGTWSPGNDAGLWVKFNLRAHHMQAQTLRRRFREAEATWTAIDSLITEHGLPERVGDPALRRDPRVPRSSAGLRQASRDRGTHRNSRPQPVGRHRAARRGWADARALLHGQPTPAPHRHRRPIGQSRPDRPIPLAARSTAGLTAMPGPRADGSTRPHVTADSSGTSTPPSWPRHLRVECPEGVHDGVCRAAHAGRPTGHGPGWRLASPVPTGWSPMWPGSTTCRGAIFTARASSFRRLKEDAGWKRSVPWRPPRQRRPRSSGSTAWSCPRRSARPARRTSRAGPPGQPHPPPASTRTLSADQNRTTPPTRATSDFRRCPAS